MSSRKEFESLILFANAIEKNLLPLEVLQNPHVKKLIVFLGEEGSKRVEIYHAIAGSTFWDILAKDLMVASYDHTKNVFWAAILRTQTKTRSLKVISSPTTTDPSFTVEIPPFSSWIRVKEFWNSSENI